MAVSQANPPIDPLHAFQQHATVLLVLVNPTARQGVPRDARTIASRLNQIIGNAGLLRDVDRLDTHQVIELADTGHDYATAAKYETMTGAPSASSATADGNRRKPGSPRAR